MSYEASGTATVAAGPGIIGSCAGAVAGLAVLGAIAAVGAVVGTCLLVGKGLYMAGNATKRAIENEIEQRREDERRRQEEVRSVLNQISGSLEAMNRGQGVSLQVIEEPVQKLTQSVGTGRGRIQFMEDRLAAIKQKLQGAQRQSSGNPEQVLLIANYLNQLRETSRRLDSTIQQEKAEKQWLSRCEAFLKESRERLEQGARVEPEQMARIIEAAPVEPTLTEEQRRVADRLAGLEACYETFVADTLLGGYLLVSETGKKLSSNIREIRASMDSSDFTQAARLIEESETLPAALVQEFSSKYAAHWGDYVSRAAHESLQAMDYVQRLKIRTTGSRNEEKVVYGYKGITGFEFRYNEETGAIGFKLDHDEFETQQACTAEAMRFVDEMRKRGIFIQINQYALTNTNRSEVETTPPQPDVVDRIVSEVQAQGWGCSVSEEGNIITVTVWSGYHQHQIETEREKGLEAVRQLIADLRRRAQHGQNVGASV